MIDKTFISIVIPSLNGKNVLPQLIDSLLVQDYGAENFEIIVVDDCSTDQSAEYIAKRFPQICLISNEKRRGAAYSKNRGEQEACGAWILFLDNDCTLDAACISELMQASRMYHATCLQPKILFYNKMHMLCSSGGVANMFGYAWDRGIHEADTGQYDTQTDILFASSAACLIRKDVFTRIGGFDEAYFYLNEDYDLGIRLRLEGEIIHYVPRAVCYHKMSYTMGREAPQVKYLIERNRIVTVCKTYSFHTLFWFMPKFLCTKYTQYKKYLSYFKGKRRKYIGSLFRAWLWIVFHILYIFRQRRKIQKVRVISDRELMRQLGIYAYVFPEFKDFSGYE